MGYMMVLTSVLVLIPNLRRLALAATKTFWHFVAIHPTANPSGQRAREV